MLVLDTNVLSEVIKPAPSEVVLAWLLAQPEDLIYTTAITEAEIFFGVWRLPNGKRRTALEDAVLDLFQEKLHGRVLPFDGRAARIYAEIVRKRVAGGHGMANFDAQIAAIALSHQASLVTRNLKDFADCGVNLINPWDTEIAATAK
jgi:predicted nucleic acid-binding protein